MTPKDPQSLHMAPDQGRQFSGILVAIALQAMRREVDRRRAQLQDIEGVEEVVEIYQHVPAVHTYRRQEDGGWEFVPVNGLECDLEIKSIGMSIPLAEIYETVTLRPEDEEPDEEQR